MKLLARYTINFKNDGLKQTAQAHTIAQAREFAKAQKMAVVFDRQSQKVVFEHNTRPLTNPRPRIGAARPMRKSERTGKKPSARLVARRKANSRIGFYPNPSPLTYQRTAWTGGSSPSNREFKITKREMDIAAEFLAEQVNDFVKYWGEQPDKDTLRTFENRAAHDAYATIRAERRAKRNPDIHIDIGSHNATRAARAKTNPVRDIPESIAATLAYKKANNPRPFWVEMQRDDGSWMRITNFKRMHEAKLKADEVAKDMLRPCRVFDVRK